MFALAGLDWRSWTAADRAAIVYRLLRQQYADDPQSLRGLYELVGDRAAVAALDRQTLGQDPTVEVTDMGVRHG